MSLRADDIAWVIIRAATAVQSLEYRELYGRRLPGGGRVDWLCSLAPSQSTSAGQVFWSGIYFDSPTPPARASQWAWMPPVPYGTESLRGVKASLSPIETARRILTEIAGENGYHQYGAAVEQAVEAALQRTWEDFSASSTALRFVKD